MNFIAVDLKIIEVTAPGLARAMALEVPTVIGSLSLLWHRCWSSKSDTISRLELRGYFQNPDAPEFLTAFGLLEPMGENWRVRGADRYLRISMQRSNAGKSRAASAGRSAGRFTSKPPADSQRTTSGGPALSPSTEHRAPRSKSTAPDQPAPVRETDLLVSDFKAVMGSDYRWQGAKDGVALASLLKTANIDEVRTRWKRGLAADASAWASCRTVAQLASKWNDLADAKPTQPPPSKPYLRDLG